MQRLTLCKYQHFILCAFTVLSKLKALQLSKVGLSTMKHQHGKNLTPWADCHLHQKTHENANCLHELFTKAVQNVHNLRGHMPGDAFSTGQLQCR